jgi:hypothetical protein
MDFIGMNPNQANANGTETMTISESFATLQGDLMAVVQGCIACAGEPEVVAGYEEFGGRWTTDLAATAAHGQSVGATTLITVQDGVGTDAINALIQSLNAPAPAAPGIGLDFN